MQKVAIITGATSGIGLAAAKLFIQKGFKVYGIARKSYAGGDFYCYSADVADFAAVDNILKDIFKKENRIDVLVNNAGFGIAGAMEEASPERIRQIIDVNLTALCVLCGKVVKYMKDGGRIINVSSVGGIIPLPYQAVYSATKAGVEIFSRALANEVKHNKIKVTAILPGDTKTGFTAARITEGENQTAKKSVEKMARDEQRGASPERVAKIIYKTVKRKNPPLRVAVGFASKAEIFLTRLLPVRLVNFIVARLYG